MTQENLQNIVNTFNKLTEKIRGELITQNYQEAIKSCKFLSTWASTRVLHDFKTSDNTYTNNAVNSPNLDQEYSTQSTEGVNVDSLNLDEEDDKSNSYVPKDKETEGEINV